ncbi:alpha/beta fold hydrolase [Methylocella tundrae]|uniref:2-hydroxymuconate semialdehyde hydrolase n=1 Tax=Methylocella tundrae TaxID=227605 RepID=A0A4U8Z5I8_METTU|nr:alpha/beta hydrolase [Methylocella tundrae]WPP04421.1 alpha/beta hydrolase [Methylocella tundrae]VFU10784.1 2-hydroxymuconate semialdehyde hydrolase [Methylocella tundrae]
MNVAVNPEIAQSIAAGEISTNYHDQGEGAPLLMIHGSGPGVSAWANWRLNIGPLSKHFRVIAPDMVGFGFTERPKSVAYGKELWLRHLADFLDSLGLEQVDIVGNSFGGGLALAFAIAHPERVGRLVLMGSVGVHFPITPGLDAVWGYEPSLEAMRGLLDIFASNRELVSDELAELRYQASIRPGFQESFSSMFPAPRQRGVDDLASSEADIAALVQPTLIIHGREDRVIPPAASRRLFELVPNAELHMFGRCGHWTQIEHTDRFNRLVIDFLRR